MNNILLAYFGMIINEVFLKMAKKSLSYAILGIVSLITSAYGGSIKGVFDEGRTAYLLEQCGLDYERTHFLSNDYVCVISEGWFFCTAVPGYERIKDFGFSIFISDNGLADCMFGRGPVWSIPIVQESCDEVESEKISKEIASEFGILNSEILSFGKTYRFLFVPKNSQLVKCDNLDVGVAVYRTYAQLDSSMVFRPTAK